MSSLGTNDLTGFWGLFCCSTREKKDPKMSKFKLEPQQFFNIKTDKKEQKDSTQTNRGQSITFPICTDLKPDDLSSEDCAIATGLYVQINGLKAARIVNRLSTKG